VINLEYVTSFVYSYFSNVTASKNGTHFLARCLLCGDSKKSKNKKRFNLEYNNGSPMYHCFNCGSSGSFPELLSKVKGIPITEALREIYRYDPELIAKRLSNEKTAPPEPIIEKQIFNHILKDCVGVNAEPEGIIEKTHQSVLLDFIKQRKVPQDTNIYIATAGEYKGRIIIPITEGEDIVYFQARSLEENPTRKYMNPQARKNIIFNKEKFERDKYIVVTESLLDAFQIPKQGTTCLGSSISDGFIDQLLNLTDTGIIIALDNDKTGKKRLIDFLNTSKAPKLKYFLMPYDEKDLSRLAIRHPEITSMYDFVVKHSVSMFEAKIRLKMMR
jgi:DNA primase